MNASNLALEMEMQALKLIEEIKSNKWDKKTKEWMLRRVRQIEQELDVSFYGEYNETK